MLKQNITYKLKDQPIRFDTVGVAYLDDSVKDDLICTIFSKDIVKIQTALYCDENNIQEYTNSKDGYIYFSNLTIPDNRRICLLGNIYCDKDEEITLVSKGSQAFSIYHNYSLTFTNNGEMQINLLKLNRGDNIFLFCFNNADSNTCFSLRVNSFKNENRDKKFSLLNKNYKLETNPVRIHDFGRVLIHKNAYEFMLIPMNTIDIDRTQKVHVILQDFKHNEIDQFECHFYEHVQYNIKKHKDANQKNIMFIEFRYTFQSNIKEDEIKLVMKDIHPYVKKIKEEAYLVISKGNSTELDKINCNAYLDIIHKLVDNEEYLMNIVYYCSCLEEIFDIVKQGKHMEDLWRKSGFHDVYYPSKIDNSIQLCHIYTPDNYNPNTQYPLFLGLATYSDCYSLVHQHNHSPTICVDAALRGVTLGSYLGEAAVFETLEFIRKIFSIDDQEVYLFGYSNGAFSAWMLSENYPDKFAGMISIGGAPFLQSLKNCSNLHIVNITSEMDTVYESGYKKPSKILNQFKNYNGILKSNMNHDEISLMMYNFNTYTDLLQHKSDRFPSSIQFETFRHKHRKAYWIELHSISFGMKSASINADIVNPHYIKISVNNADGFTVTIPPQICKNDFTVKINYTFAFEFTNYEENQIHFIKSDKGYCIRNQKPEATTSKKGTGILDIYLNSLSIVTMDNLNKNIQTIAESLAKPYTSGYIEETTVRYPIVTPENLDDEKLKNNLALISLVGNQKESTIYQLFKNLAPIKSDSDGYRYKDTFYNGNYVVMQIIANPYNVNHSILLVETNHESLLLKNVFLRKMVIPSYLNGVHRYLNNEALILQDCKYYGVYEWGGDIEEIIHK